MKIALLTDGVWPHVIGGMQKHSYFLCKYLAKYEVHVLLILTSPRPLDKSEILEDFSADERKFIDPVWIEWPRVYKFPGHYIYESYLYSKKIFQRLGGFPDVDFIIAKGLTAWYFLNNRFIESPPIGINIHGYEFLQYNTDWRMRLKSLILGKPLTIQNKKADYVFSYGGKITDYIVRLGIEREKIIEIPGAIDRDWMSHCLEPNVEKRRLLFVGRYERRKGVEELTAVINTLLSTYDFHFSFVGPIPEQYQIDHPNLTYHGVVRNKSELKELLRKNDVLVCPSYAEGMPNVVLEAMANSCSVIATDVGAVSLAVNNSNGWLIPPADIQALRSAIVGALTITEEALIQKKELSFRHIERNFLWDDVVVQLLHDINIICSK